MQDKPNPADRDEHPQPADNAAPLDPVLPARSTAEKHTDTIAAQRDMQRIRNANSRSRARSALAREKSAG